MGVMASGSCRCCYGNGYWWLVVGGCTIDVVADNGEKIIYYLMYSKYYFNV